jgi:deoxyribodipyrimidine photo-lyase
MNRSIIWFRHDLRLHDNEALTEAIRNADEVIPVYIFDHKPGRMGPARMRFLLESITDLRNALRRLGSDLIVRTGHQVEVLYQLALETKSQWIYCNRERTKEEVDVQDLLEQKLWTIGRELRYTRGKMLFHTSDLPFPVTQCPDNYALFRKEVENIIQVRQPFDFPDKLPPLPSDLLAGEIPVLSQLIEEVQLQGGHYFKGGETAGWKALSQAEHNKFDSLFIDESSHLSPWIAMGCLSPKKVYYASFDMESRGELIRNHLLYRDYLRLMGKKYGDRIFYASGIYGRKVDFDRNRIPFEKWKIGETGEPIIDAAMHQLNRTGWVPDVLRRMVAGYLLRVLRQDWRLGAYWFEYAMIDYDPCSNWVAWLNLAGIGPDSREDRVIHYDVAGKKLDPDGSYVKTWNT